MWTHRWQDECSALLKCILMPIFHQSKAPGDCLWIGGWGYAKREEFLWVRRVPEQAVCQNRPFRIPPPLPPPGTDLEAQRDLLKILDELPPRAVAGRRAQQRGHAAQGAFQKDVRRLQVGVDHARAVDMSETPSQLGRQRELWAPQLKLQF